MNITLKPLAEQVIVVTGATSGIGLVTARMAAERGASLFLIARNGDALREITADIVANGGRAGYAVADVGSAENVATAADAAIAQFGRIDTWVNNAGVAIYARLLELPLDEHQQMFRTNYFGAVNGAVTAVGHLRERGGALITIASIASDIPSPLMGAYAASKHAVKGYIGSLRIELNAARMPISVTLIKPSGIDTPIAEHAANHMNGEAQIPPPVYDPAIVARAILDAAEHPRRDVTVGGVGRLQALAGEHFPGILARFGGLMAPLLVDRTKAKTATDNLAQAGDGGRERSSVTSGRSFSLYTLGARHKLALGLGLLAGAGVLAAGAKLAGPRSAGTGSRSPRSPATGG